MSLIQRMAKWAVKQAGMDAYRYAFETGQDLNGNPERLREPYRQSAWVRSAIDKISGPIAAVPVDFYRRTDERGSKTRRYLTGRGTRVVDQEAALELPVMEAFLLEPMKGLGYSDFVEATQGWLRMAGESFWLLSDDFLPGANPPGAPKILLARPDRLRHVVEGGTLIGWKFTDGGGRQWNLLPEQVIQLKQWNPYDNWRGLGQFEAAAMAAESDWLAGRFARNLMANNGDTGPYLVAKNGIPTDEQRAQILADLRAKRQAQMRGQFRPVFLTGDISVEDPKVKSVDAAYVAGRIENRHEVYIAMGVPPSMADVKAAYSIGSASDFYQLILNTCIPAGDKFCDGLSRLARIFTGLAVEALLDWDEHPVMQEVRKERLASVDTLWSKGMPMNEISEYLSLALPRFDGDDVGYLPFSVAPAGSETENPAQNPDLAEPLEENPAVQEALRALSSRKPVPQVPVSPCLCGCSLEDADLDVKGRDSKDVAEWKALAARRLATIKAYRAQFDNVLMKARREVLAKIEAKKSFTKAAAADFLFNLINFAAEFITAMRGVSLQAVLDAGNQLYHEVGRDDPWKAPSQDTIQFIVDRKNKLQGVPDEVFGRVRHAIQEQIERGGTMTDIERAVKNEFNSISDGRGRTIAQTETAAAYGYGRHQAMVDAGIQFKRWLVSGNSNVRSAHLLMNATVVPIDEPFLVINPQTGERDQILYPAESGGAPWNVINCHCIAVSSTPKK